MNPEPEEQPTTWRTAPAPVRMCARCQKITDEPVKVREVHSDSGPGWNVYACPDCAPHYPAQRNPIAMPDAISRHRRSEEGDR